MQTKTYFASSVPAALELARKELGAEALLVNSKPAPAAAQLFGSLEVTFAFDPAPPRPSGADRSGNDRPVPERSRGINGISEAQPARALSELDEIREQLLALR
jgi:flagellar biosynthesis GTPase FlhF